MVSMRDVATLAEVSVSTVSRVLGGNDKVDASTRAKVERAIKMTGYLPNLNARSLRSRSGQLVGLAVPKIRNETFSTFIHFAEQAAHRMGYGLMLGNTENDPARERSFIEDLLSRNVDGIVLSGVLDPSCLPKQARKLPTPIVVIDRAIGHDMIPSVVVDNRGAGRMVGRMFGDGGHRRIATVIGPSSVGLVRERHLGLCEGLQEYGISLPDSYCFEGEFQFEVGVNAAESILKLRELPTAIWSQSDLVAVGVMRRILEEGLRVPEDISVVGMDDVPVSRIVRPALTTVAQPFEELCRRAFRIIHDHLKEPSYSPPVRLIEVQPSIVVRDSYHILS